jgi:hypothetical protein
MSSMRIVQNVSVVLPCDFLDACMRCQNDGSLRVELTCTKPMRVATSSSENVLLLPLLSFVAPAAAATVVVGVRVCTAATMLWLRIAPMSSAVGCCTCAGQCVGPGNSPAVATLTVDGPRVVSRCCTSSCRSHHHPQCTPVPQLGQGCWLCPLFAWEAHNSQSRTNHQLSSLPNSVLP